MSDTDKIKTKWQVQHLFVYGWDKVDEELFDTEEHALESLADELNRSPDEPVENPDHWRVDEVEVDDDGEEIEDE